jgi:glycosyltransferase involved in cell wall biosynthesis
MPAKLSYMVRAAGGKLQYLSTVFHTMRRDRSYDAVFCGHINLLPLAHLASRMMNVPLVLFIYGIDAWQPTRSRLANLQVKHALWVVSISEVTARKFSTWANSVKRELIVLPNAIHTEWYGPGEKSRTLVERYGLDGKIVLLTLGRLVSEERYKGFDEVLEILPTLGRTLPNLVYMIVGDGSDRTRLEYKARSLGVAERVVFTGNVPEAEKADHYRLADAYVMPSRGEGFGFVLLEAMACGIPVVASTLDGGREALCDGRLGTLVDPLDEKQLVQAVLEAVRTPKGIVPAGLDWFHYSHFEERAHEMVSRVLANSPQPFARV